MFGYSITYKLCFKLLCSVCFEVKHFSEFFFPIFKCLFTGKNMVKLVKYFLITVKSFIKRCKTFFLLFLELDKTFYKNMLCSPSPYLVAKSLIQWAIGVDGLVVEVVFLMTDASFLITRDIIPTTRAAFPMIEAAFR